MPLADVATRPIALSTSPLFMATGHVIRRREEVRPPSQAREAPALRRRYGIWADHHGVCHGDDFVHGEVGQGGVLADRLRARGLVDADGAHASLALLEHVAADPADVVRHLLIGHALRAAGRLLELLSRLPTAAAQNHVQA